MQKIEAWSKDVERSSQAKLKLPLLRRDAETDLLVVNFDPDLVRLLREVKYFLLLKLPVPESASQIYKKAEVFRTQTGNLDLIVNVYNTMLTSLLPVEKPLVAQYITKINKIKRLIYLFKLLNIVSYIYFVFCCWTRKINFFS